MNSIESRMVELLKEMQDKYSLTGVKAEFEAEGTRTEELMRLKEICLAAGVTLTLKIGGCEAVRDMYDARSVGVDFLVAPMVETAFALKKYIRAINTVFTEEEQKQIEFLINLETQKAVKNFDEMLNIPEISKLDGIVVGRVDLVGSMGYDRKYANSDEVFSIVIDSFRKAKERNKVTVLGGAISGESLPFLRAIPDGLINRYETRKICFLCPQALGKNGEEGILKAVEFELLWLQNKRNYYKSIAEEDESRIPMLEKRLAR
jgi:4-hydroxy-2-oxoheptanedioate aldolase